MSEEKEKETKRDANERTEEPVRAPVHHGHHPGAYMMNTEQYRLRYIPYGYYTAGDMGAYHRHHMAIHHSYAG